MNKRHEKRKEKLGDGIYNLHEAGTANFILYFLKINFFHVFFEVLFAVLFINLMIFYSPLVITNSGNKIDMSAFFGQVLFSCGIIYLIITIIFIFIIIKNALHYIEGGNIKQGEGNNLQKKETYEKAIKKSIIWGLLAHILVGILTAFFPSFFTGVKEVTFDCCDRLKIGIAIVLFGVGGAILSWLRYKRINWIEVTKNKETNEYTNYINTLSYTLISALAQVIITCIIVIIFAIMFMNLAPIDDFNYYNLLLAIVFAIISTYVTIVYKKEFFGHKIPGFSIKPCKKTE